MQPVVVVVLEVDSVTAVCVVMDSVQWKISAVLKAVDICFKTFHVFHVAYPAESHVLFLLQELFFSIATKWDFL